MFCKALNIETNFLAIKQSTFKQVYDFLRLRKKKSKFGRQSKKIIMQGARTETASASLAVFCRDSERILN